MESPLGNGASCQFCREAFGRFEDLKAPFTISCGHIFCIGCLSVADPTCRVCGNIFDRQPILRLFTLHDNTRRRSSITSSEEEFSRIQEQIASLNPTTPISRLRHVYTQGSYFLESQPRNLFKELDTNLNLLDCLLQAKDALLAQNKLVESLSERVHQVKIENEGLQLSLQTQSQLHTQDIDGIRNHFSRADENVKPSCSKYLSDINLFSALQFNLVVEERDALQRELNNTKASLEVLCNGVTSTTPIAFPDDSEFAPRIRVQPASRSPSIASVAANSPETQYELSPLEMSAISQSFGETGGTQLPTIHRRGSFHSLSSTGSEGSLAESLFIRPFEVDLAYDPSISSHNGPEYSHTLGADHRELDLADSFLGTLFSQAPSVEDEASVAENDDTTADEDEQYDPDDADSIMAMSTSALPILRTPEPSRRPSGQVTANIPPTIRTEPAPFLSNLAILNDLLNDSRDHSATPTAANLLSRAAELLSSGSVARPSDNPRAGQRPRPQSDLIYQGFSMAEMRSCLLEVIARVFVNLVSDPNLINQPSVSTRIPTAAAMYVNRESSGYLDSLMEDDHDVSNSDVAPFATLSESPTLPSGMNSDSTADLIDFGTS